MKKPLITIIIPTYNSQDNIKSCLESIKKQEYKNYEVIVVDQSSFDQTVKIAKSYGAKVISRELPKFYSPPSISRNIGAKAAKGAILYHLDSDMVLQKELLAEIIKLIDNKHGALIVHEVDLVNGFWGKCKAFERKCYWGDDKIESARVVSKKLFDKVEGYDPKVSSGEDFNIHKKYKKLTSINFCKKVVFHRLGGLGYWMTLKKKFNYGKTATIYNPNNAESGLYVLAAEVGCFAKNYRRFITSPIYGSGALFLKFSEFIAGSLGFFFQKVRFIHT